MIGICPSLEEDIYKYEQDRGDSPNKPNELYTVTTKGKKKKKWIPEETNKLKQRSTIGLYKTPTIYQKILYNKEIEVANWLLHPHNMGSKLSFNICRNVLV